MKTRSLLSLAVAALLAACGGGAADTPTQVAEKYLTALNKQDFDAAKKLGTEKTVAMLDMIAPMMKMMGDAAKEKSGFKILGEKIEGEKATVTYRGEGKDADETVTLVQMDGKWLVDMAKEEGGDTEGGDLMNLDSLMEDGSEVIEENGEVLEEAAQ
ncbi:MAG: DUF4878 domain-containing protein [Flavobacteriales bacterium]|nr:DUF4878 domain-containing protein [Flavobacteriales bacterium]